MPRQLFLLIFLFLTFGWNASSQEKELSKPVFMGSAKAVPSGPLSEKELLPPTGEFKIFNPRNRGSNKVVPGKGTPKRMDAAWQKKPGEIEGKAPILSFDAATSGSTPSDPTGAVGPNHYVNAWNYSFAIYDKQGNLLLPPTALSSLGGVFEGEKLGDPIVFYDEFADRFLITQFSDTPNSFLVAVSKGPDPVNDGWYTYRFPTGNTFPDYPKFFIWSDGYYITTNKDSKTAEFSEVVYVLERDKIINGLEAQHVGFPLPGINTNGFYSPAGFFAVGEELPPKGDAPILYFQDDAWEGVSVDHLKIWLINVNWGNISESTIEESQELGPAEGITPFNATFDGGSFTNLSQVGDNPDVDALQGAIMYMTQYRRFPTHNSVVLNFVVDVDGSPAEHAGIRWYELRQNEDGAPWEVFQEGTYAPDNSDRWCGTIGIDEKGNIGLGFTLINDSPENPIHPSLLYTGRYSGDPLGVMTIEETFIVEGPSPDPSFRYGDYAQLTIDPVDDATFWYIGEYFVDTRRHNRVGVFKLVPEVSRDVGVVELISPVDATLGNAEEITVTIRNFGAGPQSNIPVSFSVDGGETITEIYTGTIPAVSEANFTFSTFVDLSEPDAIFEIFAETNLEGDLNPENDAISVEVENLEPRDIGITSIDAPVTGIYNNSIENVTVTVENFGGEPQTGFPLFYTVNGGEPVMETFDGVLEVGEEISYTFDTGADISSPGAYEFFASTSLEGDSDELNDFSEKIIANLSCIPEGSDCGLGDGIFNFFLGSIANENIPCNDGYADFIGSNTKLDRAEPVHEVTVGTRYSGGEDERFSMWIDFNDDGFFDESEMLINSEIIPTAHELHTYEFSIPRNAPLGEHILRIRAGNITYGNNLNNPCSVMEFGTTHDYSVTIVDSDLEIDDLDLNEAELIISTRDHEIFEISMLTNFEEDLRITVHDLLGQKLVENILKKEEGIYYYKLDMSYAATGVYLVRVGTRKVGKVKRILVK